jgi:hypothetical protein
MRAKLILIGVPFLILLLSPLSAYGCSCMVPGPPCSAFGGSAAVFVGTVTGVTDKARLERDGARKREDEIMWTPLAFKFAVAQSFLGVEGTEIEISTGRGGGDCGYNFRRGESYLVYAYRNAETGLLSTGICTRTKPASDATEDLEFLRTLGSRAPGVVISGTVVLERSQEREETKPTRIGVAAARVVIVGEGTTKEVVTDAKGAYAFSGLSAGRYKVKLLLPDELTVWSPERDIALSDRGCATVDYFVSDNGRVRGKVTDAEGKPAARIQVTLVRADDPELKGELTGYEKYERTDDQGNYAFKAVQPGRYLLAVNLSRYPQLGDPTRAFPRTFYPGVAEASKAEVISVGVGEELADRDLVLPVPREQRSLEIKIIWDDGQPVSNANASFTEVTYGGPDTRASGGNSLAADAKGGLTLKGYEGQVLLLNARSNRPFVGDFRRDGPMERTEPVRVVLGETPGPLTVIIVKLR